MRSWMHNTRILLFRTVGESSGLLVGWLISWVPERDNLWAFGAWHGVAYCDNPRYLMQAMSREAPTVQCVWLTRRWGVRQRLRAQGVAVHAWWEPSGLRVLCRARVVLYTHDPADLSPIVNRRCLRVNLTHGTPLKLVGRSLSAAHRRVRYPRLSRARTAFLPPPSLTIAASPAAVERWEMAVSGRTRVVATGMPRWRAHLGTPIASTTKTLLYAPTHRSVGREVFDPTQLAGLREFTTWAQGNNVRLLHRSHRSGTGTAALPGWEDVGPDIIEDTSELLRSVNILITDYSSLFYDFGICSGHMGFLIPDVRRFSAEGQGIYPAALRDMVGPRFNDWFDALAWVQAGAPPSPDYPRFKGEHAVLADVHVNARILSAVAALTGSATCSIESATNAHESRYPWLAPGSNPKPSHRRPGV